MRCVGILRLRGLFVCEELGIGLGTVKTHIMRIFAKLCIENRTSLAGRIQQIGAKKLIGRPKRRDSALGPSLSAPHLI
jgi:hypothetical protein